MALRQCRKAWQRGEWGKGFGRAGSNIGMISFKERIGPHQNPRCMMIVLSNAIQLEFKTRQTSASPKRRSKAKDSVNEHRRKVKLERQKKYG